MDLSLIREYVDSNVPTSSVSTNADASHAIAQMGLLKPASRISARRGDASTRPILNEELAGQTCSGRYSENILANSDVSLYFILLDADINGF